MARIYLKPDQAEELLTALSRVPRQDRGPLWYRACKTARLIKAASVVGRGVLLRQLPPPQGAA